MRDDFGALFAATASLRRDPTAPELAGGIPCGPFSQQLLNELFFAESSMLSELNRVLDAASIVPDETLTNQLLAAIQSLISANVPAALFAAPARGIMALNTAQTIASGAATDITSYGAITNNLPSSTISNGVITIGAGDAGVYSPGASFRFSGNAQAYNIFSSILLNGGSLSFNQAFNPNNGDVFGGLSVPAQSVRLVAGDQLKLNINQTNSSAAARGFAFMTFGLMRLGA